MLRNSRYQPGQEDATIESGGVATNRTRLVPEEAADARLLISAKGHDSGLACATLLLEELLPGAGSC